jgi:hypothetical protein
VRLEVPSPNVRPDHGNKGRATDFGEHKAALGSREGCRICNFGANSTQRRSSATPGHVSSGLRRRQGNDIVAADTWQNNFWRAACHLREVTFQEERSSRRGEAQIGDDDGVVLVTQNHVPQAQITVANVAAMHVVETLAKVEQ